MFNALFQPIKIGRMEIKNRFVMPPMGSNLGNRDGSASDALIEYYARRARGGFGLIITECTAVSPDGSSLYNETRIYDDRFIDGYRKLTDRVHEEGGKIAMQLVHHGRQGGSVYIGGKKVSGPSSVPCPLMQQPVHAMTTEEVYQEIDHFVQAAVRVKKAGFDAVELHVASGYLIEQFLSQHSNKRIDEFGGTLHNRMRFLLEIIKGIKRYNGNDFPILVRLCIEEFMTGGIGVEEGKAICRAVESAGADALDITAGTYGSLPNIIGCSYFQPGYLHKYARTIKEIAHVPVIGVGRFTDPYICNEAVESKDMDLVGVGRQAMADPDFPNKVLAGDLDDICPCISCNQGCIHQLFADKHVTCVVNPFNGNETEKTIIPAVTKKKIAVIGGGPAGLEAAWIMAKRGHKVDLYECEDHLGGAFLVAAYPPAKTDITKMLAYYIHQCKKYDVEIHLSSGITEESLQDIQADAVVIATGSKPLLPPIEGIHNETFMLANDVLVGKKVTGHRVLIAGGGLIGAETADFLCEQTRECTIVEMKPEIAPDLPAHNRPVLLDILNKYGVDMITGAKILRFEDHGVAYEKNGEKVEIGGFDTIVLAMGTVSYNPLEEQARKIFKEVHVIGDAGKAGNVLTATHDAMDVAIEI